jgi:serine/threonine protein kinase
MGTCPTKRHIYIIDFGLSRRYRDSETNIHIPFRDGLPLIGTVRYASVNALMGFELSRRDDIESLAYILIYLMRGSLPWQGTTKAEKRQANVREKKLSMNPEVLCDGLPIAFKKCLQYSRSLEFSERPDYQYLRGLFTDLSQQLVHDDFEFPSLGKTPSRSVAPPITGSDSTKTETLPIQKKKRRVRGVQR